MTEIVVLGVAVLAGVMTGFMRARAHQRQLSLSPLTAEWLVLIAVLPQLLVFYVVGIERIVPQAVAAFVLIGSQLLLLLFVLLNRNEPMLLVLGVGLVLNFCVIVSNGGLMPISPETILRLDQDAQVDMLMAGERVRGTKDVLLPVQETRLAFLSDRFILPTWLPLLVAYSVGDVLIAGGAFGFFWRAGGPQAVGRYA